MSMSNEALARLKAHRELDGKFGPQQLHESGLVLGVSGFNGTLKRFADLLGERLARLEGDEHLLTDTAEEKEFDPDGRRRAYPLREAGTALVGIMVCDLTEAEQAAALAEAGSSLRNAGFPDIGNDMTTSAFDRRKALAGAGAGFTDTEDLAFEDCEEPEGPSSADMHRFTSRLKLAGISGTIRSARVDGQSVTAEYTDPQGRSFDLKMGRGKFNIIRSDADQLPLEFDELSEARWESAIIRPKTIAKAVREARQTRAVTDSWIANAGLKSNAAITFSEQEVIRNGLTEAAAFNAKTGKDTYRVLRIMDRSTGTAETRVFTVGDEGSGVKTTTAIINEITEAAGAGCSRDVLEHRLANFLDEALHDPAWQEA